MKTRSQTHRLAQLILDIITAYDFFDVKQVAQRRNAKERLYITLI